MTKEQIIQRLRQMLFNAESQDDYDTLCAAIRALGGTP